MNKEQLSDIIKSFDLQGKKTVSANQNIAATLEKQCSLSEKEKNFSSYFEKAGEYLWQGIRDFENETCKK